MIISPRLEYYTIGDEQVALYVPDPEAVHTIYLEHKEAAYWAKVWPAAVGLCNFLQMHPHFISGKNVLELAAGLGLCGLYTAAKARRVTITDIAIPATAYVAQSVAHIGLQNVTPKTLDWNDAQQEEKPDLVLLSDVNYDPAVFVQLKKVLETFLENGVTVIISTPQRLVAKDFILSLMPYSVLQWHEQVLLDHKETDVSVFVLAAD